MRFLKFKSWVAGLCVLALVGCGGGGSGGTPVLGPDNGGGSTAASVDVSASPTILGDGESTVTITAIVKDSKNVGLANATLAWETTAGSTLTGAPATTDENGRAQATFSASVRSASTATVKVVSGAASGSVQVGLQSTRSVVITPNKTEVGTDGDTVVLTAIVKDRISNVAIPGAAVTWSATEGNLSGQTSVTNAQGVATATFSPGSKFVTPTATVTVTSGNGSDSVPLNIRATTTSIELLASQPSINTGGDQVTVSAFVKDASNIARVGVPVAWSVDLGRLSSITTVTDSNGLARATLDAGSNKANRTAVVTATSGAARQTLNLPVTGTKLSSSGPTSAAAGSSLTLTFNVADSKQVAVPGVVLSISSSLGNGIPATATTDAAGQVTLQYVATRPGSDSIIVSGAGATLTVPMTVTGTDEDLAFTAPTASSQVVVNTVRELAIRYRKAGVPQPNVRVNLAATIGTIKVGNAQQSFVITGPDGTAVFTLQSGFAGPSMISATLDGSEVQATLPLRFVATVPANLVLQVTPTALAPNLGGSEAQKASLVAKVIDVNGNPVAGSTINFSQFADPSGGTLQNASAVTDANGQATVQYLSGATPTANNAVQLRATVASNTAVSGTAAMTVNQSALFIALGTGNTIANFSPETYEKNWTVYVTDSTGVRVPGVPVTVKLIPNFFAKGRMEWSEAASLWVYSRPDSNGDPTPQCANEDGASNPGRPDSFGNPPWALGAKPADFNANGRLDPGEDRNGDGNLTPGNVVALVSSTVTTDANGAATITMRYAELYAPWLNVRLTATAIVAGTESTAFKDFWLDKLAGDFSVKTNAPAGVRSPFGLGTQCTDTD